MFCIYDKAVFFYCETSYVVLTKELETQVVNYLFFIPDSSGADLHN